MNQQFGHYFRACPHERVDVYRVLELFGVTDPCLQHAIKKLIVAGGRGHKDIDRDIAEAIASLKRWQEMRREDLDAEAGDPVRMPPKADWRFKAGEEVVVQNRKTGQRRIGTVPADGRLLLADDEEVISFVVGAIAAGEPA